MRTGMRQKGSYDYYLVLATTVVLFIISAICIQAMFYFKLAGIQQLEPALKAAYLNRMNSAVAPFIGILILLLGICVPKRLLPARWLNWFAGLLVVLAVSISVWQGVKAGLLGVLCASLLLQGTVLALAVAGYAGLTFERKGYWVRVGSSCIHLGLILFVLDLYFYRDRHLHLPLFWVTTISSVIGMFCCFYADSVAGLVRKARGEAARPAGKAGD